MYRSGGLTRSSVTRGLARVGPAGDHPKRRSRAGDSQQSCTCLYGGMLKIA